MPKKYKKKIWLLSQKLKAIYIKSFLTKTTPKPKLIEQDDKKF